jgi:hypothetical protein
MAEFAERSGRARVALDPYWRVYVPLSTCVAHPTGMALLRHVDRDQESIEKPSPAWTRRAAVHAADACLGTQFMGHSKIQTTFDVYGHLLPGSHDEVRQRMDAYLGVGNNA